MDRCGNFLNAPVSTRLPQRIIVTAKFLFQMSGFRICGLKLAIFGTVLSIWGIFQLSFMAIAFYKNSVAFVEDLPESVFKNCTERKCTYTATVDVMKAAYGQQAENCGIAVALYIVTLVVCLHQLWMNSDRGWFYSVRLDYRTIC